MYEGKIPFDQHGNPVPYAPGRASLVWKDNEVFRATLTFKGFRRGRSAVHAIYAKADDPSWQVAMFISDLEDILKRPECSPSCLRGRFVFVKRGQNFGIKQLLIDA